MPTMCIRVSLCPVACFFIKLGVPEFDVHVLRFLMSSWLIGRWIDMK